MEYRTLPAFLRVLYTVNSNPQYILAKSASQTPVIPCNETPAQSATDEPTYARASLKACLAAICDSSPELLQDPTRDFSLYFLDPLETQPQPTGLAHASTNTTSPRGVAVALGLMSWALESNDSINVFITGTIVPNASPSLEVICALRETKRMPKPVFYSYPSYSSISAPGPSPHHNPLYPPQNAGMSWLSASHFQRHQQQPRTLTRSADFPELYIGPPRRARGRPEGSTSSKARLKAQASASSVPGESSSKVTETRSESKEEVGKRPKQTTKSRPPRAPPTQSPFSSAPLPRDTATARSEGDGGGIPVFNQQLHGQTQSHPHAEHYSQAQSHPRPIDNPLLGLFTAISSTAGNTAANATPEQQAALLSALHGLFAANPHLLQFAPTGTGLPTSIGEKSTQEMHRDSDADDGHDDGDSDIVILDSSTIDAKVFRKPSARQRAASNRNPSPSTANQEHPVPSMQDIDSSPLPASTPPPGLENTSASSRTSTLESKPPVVAGAGTPASKHIFPELTSRGGRATLHPLDTPATPTPSRTRKRKLDEYSWGQGHSPAPISPPSPSPSVTRTSSSGRALTMKHRVQSSPTGGTGPMSSSVRLPSMLGSMRSMAVSSSRLQASSSGPSNHGRLTSLTTDQNGYQLTTLSPCPLKSEGDHTGTTDASSNGTALDATSSKRRRTLTEFMAEREARKSAKVRKQSSSRREDVSTNASRAAPLRSANLGSTLRHAQSSPSRPLFRSDPVASTLPLATSTSRSSIVPGTGFSNPPSSSTTTLTSTGLSTSNSTVPQARNPLKNFVLPAWARTSTATLPRLSEEVLARQRAEQEAKKAQVSLRRREAAKAKRKQLHRANHPSKESSDEDDEPAMSNAELQTLLSSSSKVRSALLLPPPLPSLPVFASDAVEPIPSSPPQSRCQFAPPGVPSTPPRKPVSVSGSGSRRTPSKSGSCSLFTPSGQDLTSLFTPSTPSVTRSLTRSTFTPCTPTVLGHSGGTKKSPRKSMFQSPKRNSSDHPTPRSLRTDRSLAIASPSKTTRTPGTGTRPFLLPPPSPCGSRTPMRPNEAHSKVSGGSPPIAVNDSGSQQQTPASDIRAQNVEQDDNFKDEDMLIRELNDALLGEDVAIPSAQCTPSQGESEPRDITGGDANLAEEEFAPSPLPPSSPLPASPISSPAKHSEGSPDATHAVPDAGALWLLSDDGTGAPPAWFTDSDASAWLTETETWLTDTEGGLLPTDSDGAWLSDSDAMSVFGDMTSLIPSSSASNWFSDTDVDVGTDGEVDSTGADGGFGMAAFQRTYAALVEHEGQSGDTGVPQGGDGDTPSPSPASHGAASMTVAEAEFWKSMQPLLGESTASETAPDTQALLDGLVGPS